MLNITCWSKREIGVLVLRLGGVVPWSIARLLSSLIAKFLKVDGGKTWAFMGVCVWDVWGYSGVKVE